MLALTYLLLFLYLHAFILLVETESVVNSEYIERQTWILIIKLKLVFQTSSCRIQ